MAEYDNTNRFALFKNDKKGNDKAPDYKGSINVAGVDMDMAAWIRTSKTGEKFMSGQISAKREKGERPDPVAKTFSDDDDIPF